MITLIQPLLEYQKKNKKKDLKAMRESYKSLKLPQWWPFGKGKKKQYGSEEEN